MDSVPLAPISGGLNESTAPGEQPAGTYSQGVNVRGIDPRTGRRVWGAQRAGLTQVGDAFPSGAYPRHFAFAAKLLSAREWQNLTTTPDTTSDPQAVAVAWTARLGETVLDVAEGPLDGAGYFLLESGEVAVVNKSGTETERLPTATPRGFRTVPRVFLDETGALYTAASRDDEFEGGAGRVYRWVKDTEGNWSQAWESVITGRIRTFVYENGAMYLAEEPVEADQADVEPTLTRIGAPTIGPEVLWRQPRVAWPIINLAVTPRGQCIASSPYSTSRSGGAGFTTRSVSWTPPELASWPIKGWAWLDAQLVNEGSAPPGEGDAVTVLLDRRFEETDFEPINENSPRREMREADSDLYTAPTWDPDAFGGQGGVKFGAGKALVSGPAETLPGTTAAGEAAGVTHGTIIPTDEDSWTVVMLVQFTDAQAAATQAANLLTQRTEAASQADWRLFTTALDVQLRELTQPQSTPAGTTAATARTAIIAAAHEGTGSPLRLYVNGTEATPAVSFTNVKQDGAYDIGGSDVATDGPFTTMGGGRPNRSNLLNQSTAVATYFDGTSSAPASLSRLRDGVRRRSGPDWRFIFGPHIPIAAGPGGGPLASSPRIRIDLGASLRIDSFATWSTSNRWSASQATFRFSNTAFGTWDVEQTVYPSQGAGDDTGVRDEWAIDGAASAVYRYIEIQPTDFYNSGDQAWQISELEFFAQDTETGADSADFAFGELVAIQGTSTTERQQLEGYIAHRWGLAHTLDAAHPHDTPGTPVPGTGSTGQDAALVAAELASPFPVVAKYGTDGTPLAAFTGAGVGLGAGVRGDHVFTIGDPSPPGTPSDIASYGDLIARFEDGPRTLTREAGLTDSNRPSERETPLSIGPCDTVFVPWTPLAGTGGTAQVRRYDGDALTLDWGLNVARTPRAIAKGGLQYDGTEQGLAACGPEFLYLADAGLTGAQRVDVLGLRETGVVAQRDVERLAVLSEGSVYRENGSGWELLEAAALPGPLPFSVYLDGLTIFADGEGYRAYRNASRTFINFEDEVKGDFPPRCQLIAAYRGRLMLARGDNAFTIYQSAWGDPFDFDFGREVQSLDQAAAGTIASQGRVPEPITALMPFSDDFLFIGTTEGLWVLSGDLSDGGRLDQVDRSQGVAFGYAWCHAQRSIYYFSARGGVMQIAPGGGSRMVSEGAIQRRLEDIDLDANRVRLAYNFIDKTVHVYVIPHNLGDRTQHFVFEEMTGGWHVDEFGEGPGGVVTAADTLAGDKPDDRALMLGFSDGRACAWDQYAADDAGRAVRSSAVVGPVVPDSANVEVNVSGVRATLASEQGPIQVAARGSNEPDRPGPPGPFRELRPGRGYGVPLNVTAPAVFVEVRGTGRAWSLHQLRAELGRRGRGRNVS